MQTLKVDLGERSYPIHIGEGLLDQPELLAPHIRGRQVAIISNETVAPLYLERLTRSLAQFSVISVVLPDGEAFKTWETLQLIFRRPADCTARSPHHGHRPRWRRDR